MQPFILSILAILCWASYSCKPRLSNIDFFYCISCGFKHISLFPCNCFIFSEETPLCWKFCFDLILSLIFIVFTKYLRKSFQEILHGNLYIFKHEQILVNSDIKGESSYPNSLDEQKTARYFHSLRTCPHVGPLEKRDNAALRKLEHKQFSM